MVETAQLKQGFNLEDSHWSHVALYVGDLHILESQSTKDKEFLLSGKLRAGVQLKPIAKYTQNHDFRVLRHKSAKYDEVRVSVARYALLDHGINRRGYAWFRAIKAGLYTPRNPIKPPNLNVQVICSEFVLECLAIGGKTFVQEYNDVVNGSRFFYPADFAQHQNFDYVDVGLLEVTTEVG